MNDGCARAEDAGSKAFPTHLVGVGPDEEFATAKQLTSGPVTWLGNVENLEAFLDRPPLAHPCVILLDGDLPSERLIASLDQNAALLKATPMLLQITKPPVRLAVVIMQRGVRDVLQKPYTLARLRAALEELRSLFMVGIRDPAAADQCSNAMCCAIMGSLVASVIGGKLVDALGVTAQVVPKP